MIHRTWELRVEAPIERVWEFHSSAEAVEILSPPERRVRLAGPDSAVEDGALHVLKGRVFGLFPFTWKARISDVAPPTGFTDTAERSPFKSWSHRHEFVPDGSGTIIRDSVHYELPGGPLGRIADWLFVRRDLDRLWSFRHAATLRCLSLEHVDASANPALAK